MRPRGEVRQALAAAVQSLQAEGRPCATWRDAAQRAVVTDAHGQTKTGVAWKLAKQTVRDMVRAGELQPVGLVRVPHARRPMVLYAQGNWTTACTATLDSLMRTWR